MKGKYIVVRVVDDLLGTVEAVPEPFFVLRAKDIFAAAAIAAYYDTVCRHHPSGEFCAEIRAVLEQFVAWKTKHPQLVGVPD